MSRAMIRRAMQRRPQVRHLQLVKAMYLPRNLYVSVELTTEGHRLFESYNEAEREIAKLSFPGLSDAEIEELVLEFGLTPYARSGDNVIMPLTVALKLLVPSLGYEVEDVD